MIREENNRIFNVLFTGSLFIIYFLYFSIFNRYHIIYLEQNQLFLFDIEYLTDHFTMPGGLPLYIGRFFTQFFISPLSGALIITLNALAVYVLTINIYRKHNFVSIISAIIPVWLLLILQSNELFTLDQSIGSVLTLSFFAIYISFSKSSHRYIFYFTAWPVFYFLSGGFSIPAIFLCILHELIFKKQKNRYITSVLMIISGILIPLIFANTFFYIPGKLIFTYPIFLNLHSIFLFALILLYVWYPMILFFIFPLTKSKYLKQTLKPGYLTRMISTFLIIALMGFTVYRFAYNQRTELMLGIDHHIQQADWGKVLNLSDRYPDINSLVIYYTNLALYKSGLLSDRMFSYPQIGANGLRLRWERNLNLFFGGEIFYYLSYTNEANRWAFEAMVAKGLNPRSLKRLVITSIINGESEIAKKYIHKLNHTLFYRKWSLKYKDYLSDPSGAFKDPEISRNLELMVHSDFTSNAYNLNLENLLINRPENKAAYEYYMASLLLDKRLDEFAVEILGLKNYNYPRMPVHFEEALIFYNSYENKNIMPEGYSFRPETIRRFQDYAKTYSIYRSNLNVATDQLKKRYGKTFWYYLQFINN